MPEPEHPSERINDGFLSRWSERKLAPRDGTALDSGSPSEDAPRQRDSTAANNAAPNMEPAGALTDADMPPLEKLDADSDFSSFLSQGVSDSLRNQALKKLFFSGRFDVIDGLDDYAEDFTQFAALGDIVTAEMRHRIEMAANRCATEDEAAADMDTQTAGADGASETGSGDKPLEAAATDTATPATPENASVSHDAPPPVPSPSAADRAREKGGQEATGAHTARIDTDAEGRDER